MKKILFILILFYSNISYSYWWTADSTVWIAGTPEGSMTAYMADVFPLYHLGGIVSTIPGVNQVNQMVRTSDGVISGNISSFYVDSGCILPQIENSVTGLCYTPSDCSDTSTPGYFNSILSSSICSGGCLWSSGGGVTIIRDGLTIPYYKTGTAQVCTVDESQGTAPLAGSCDGEVCPSDNPECVIYKGVEVCPDITNDDCITNDSGKVICASDTKNCWEENGMIICSSTQSEVPDNCIRNADGQVICIGDTVETSETETTKTEVIDADTTTTTTTKTKTDNVEGHNDSTFDTVSTTYIDPVTGEETTSTETTSTGDCDPSKEDCSSESESGSASGGLTCDSPPVCEGDIIHCHQIRLDWEHFCANNEEVTIDEQAVLSDIQGDITIDTISDSPIDFAGAIDSNYFTVSNGSSTCPASLPITIMGTGHQFSYQPLCDTAEMINPFIIFAGLISSLYILFREQS